MNFDWYGASVDVDPAEALGEASRWLDHCDLVPRKGRNGYRAGATFSTTRGRVLEVDWENLGAPHAGCYFESSGKWAYPLSHFLRSWKPVHRVARADIAEDYAGEGTWERLSGVCLDVADRFNVKVEHAGDHHRAIEGRSYYVGGRYSVVRAVCYEKGIQLRGDPTHVRLELRVRPGDRAAKLRAAAAEPLEFYGASVWSQDLATQIGRPDVARLSLGTVYREDDVTRSRFAMLRQYGNVLQGLKAEVAGESWAEVGNWIGNELAVLEARRRK